MQLGTREGNGEEPLWLQTWLTYEQFLLIRLGRTCWHTRITYGPGSGLTETRRQTGSRLKERINTTDILDLAQYLTFLERRELELRQIAS